MFLVFSKTNVSVGHAKLLHNRACVKYILMQWIGCSHLTHSGQIISNIVVNSGYCLIEIGVSQGSNFAT